MLLSNTLEDVRAMEGLHNVLNETQRKKVKYAGLDLAAAVTRYLVKAILYLEGKGIGMVHLHSCINESFSKLNKKAISNDDCRV